MSVVRVVGAMFLLFLVPIPNQTVPRKRSRKRSLLFRNNCTHNINQKALFSQINKGQIIIVFHLILRTVLSPYDISSLVCEDEKPQHLPHPPESRGHALTAQPFRITFLPSQPHFRLIRRRRLHWNANETNAFSVSGEWRSSHSNFDSRAVSVLERVLSG